MIVNGVSVPDEVQEPTRSGATRSGARVGGKGTIPSNYIVCPDCGQTDSLTVIDIEKEVNLKQNSAELYCSNCDTNFDEDIVIRKA